MIQLYYNPGSASMAPHIVLEELGVPFELVLTDTSTQAHKRPEYLRLNPNGVVPTLVDGDLVLYETAAILLHLADTHAAQALMPALGTADRAQAYKWLIWLTNTLQARLIAYFYPERWSASRPDEVKAQAQASIQPMLQQLDDQLAAHGQPWLLGATYSAVDAMAFMMGRWTRHFQDHPARSFPHLGPYLQRMLTRPAVQRVFAREEIQAPLV